MKQLILFALLIWGGFNFAQVPKTISYQGVLNKITGTPVADGNYSVAFKLYESEAGSQAVWEEVQQVSVASGIFNTIPGKANFLTLPFDKIYWLGITINSDTELVEKDNQIRDLHLDIKNIQDRISRLEEGIQRKSEFTNQ